MVASRMCWEKWFGDGGSLSSRCQRMGLGDTAVDHTDTVGMDSADGTRVRRKRCLRAKDINKHGGLWMARML